LLSANEMLKPPHVLRLCMLPILKSLMFINVDKNAAYPPARMILTDDQLLRRQSFG